MNELTDVGREPPNLAADRLAEMKDIYDGLRAEITVALTNFGKPTAEMPAAILKKISQLRSAHLALVAAEDTFNAQFGSDEDDNATNYDAIRVSIGGKLDRIRDSHGTE